VVVVDSSGADRSCDSLTGLEEHAYGCPVASESVKSLC
jgi:hypothetical protein